MSISSSDPVFSGILQGKGFYASMPNLAPGAGSNYAWQLFNPSNSFRNIYIWSLQLTNASGNTNDCYLTSQQVDFSSFTPVNATIKNLNLSSGNTSLAVCQYTTVGGSPSIGGISSRFFEPIEIANQTIEFFPARGGVLLAPGTGLYLITFLNANNAFSITTKYLEY